MAVTPDLVDLARRASAGEAAAADELLRELEPLVVRTVRLVVGSGSWAAEDAAQDALLDIDRGIASLRDPQAVKGWARCGSGAARAQGVASRASGLAPASLQISIPTCSPSQMGWRRAGAPRSRRRSTSCRRGYGRQPCCASGRPGRVEFPCSAAGGPGVSPGWLLRWCWFVGAAYTAGFNPFAGISAANHPATQSDLLPAFLTAPTDEFSSAMEQMGHGHLLPDTGRFITDLPSGMRFSTIATSAGGLCLANVDPPGSNAQGAFFVWEFTQPEPANHHRVGTRQPSHPSNPLRAGDGRRHRRLLYSGRRGGDRPVTDTVWAYEGQADLISVTVHWETGSTQTLIHGR